MSENPAYPDADPTAPGGMSREALRKELTTRHGYLDIEVDETMMNWPQLIDAVVAGRKAREQEAAAIAAHTPQVVRPATSNDLLLLSPDTLDYTFSGHAGAGPSGASRWMSCTKSLGLSRTFLETLTQRQAEAFAHGSEAARQGTTAHAAAEAELSLILGHTTVAERDHTLLELSIMPPDTEAYDDDMGDGINLYVDLVRQFIADRGEDHVLIESKLEAAVWLTGDHADDYHIVAGSADAVALPTDTDKTLVVIDLKYGVEDVEVEENSQLRLYGIGALALLADEDGNLPSDLDEIVYYIVQPRSGGIKEWRESVTALLDWRDEVLSPALTAALFDDGSSPAEFKPSPSACHWCPARGTCAALAADTFEKADELFTVVTEEEFEYGPGAIPETTSLDSATLGRLLKQVDDLDKVRGALREEAQRRLHRGDAVPGYKMVTYQPPRKWTDTAAEALRETFPALFTEKMVTPKQGTALAGDEAAALADYIETPDPRPVIAADNDRRKEWTGKAPESMFDNEEGE